jgi:hypothetical protein
MWTTRTRFYWTQTFPPDRPVVVEHSYKPVVGQSGLGAFLFAAEDPTGADFIKRFCIAGETEAALRERFAGSTPEQPTYFHYDWVQYVLMTANNWKGPIGRFHLTVDKGDADTILATCAAGLTVTGPATLEFEAEDYAPAQDLDLLFVRNHPPGWAE